MSSDGMNLVPPGWKRNEIKMEGSDYIYEVQNNMHNSSCTENYYQCSLQSTETNMVLELFVQIITEPCFNILRTQEQLGYIVFSGIRRAHGVQGLHIMVQSDKHPDFIDNRIERFLHQMKDHLGELKDEEFDRHKEALAAQRLEKPKRLSALSSQFWSEIISRQYNFDRAKIEVEQLHTLTKSDILKFYNDLLSCESQQRRKLSIHVLSTTERYSAISDPLSHVQSKAVKIKDITQFKSSQSLFPLVQPYINIEYLTKSKL